MTPSEPRFTHRCEQRPCTCEFLGQLDQFDLYVCGLVLVARFGNDHYAERLAAPIVTPGRVRSRVFAEAERRARELHGAMESKP